MLWTSKHRPDNLQNIVGNSSQIKELKNWADNWTPNDKPIILYGPPGLGKTTSAYALAEDMNWEVMEMNASDKRTGEIIDRIAGEASKTTSLTGKKRKLIVLDEADNLHGHSDRGGKSAITRTIKKSKQPIILIANDYYDLTRGLRNATKGIEFKPIDDTKIAKALRDICNEKDIDYDIDSLRNIAENADGDLRAAVNDLQKNAVGKQKLKSSDIKLDNRNKKTKIFPFLNYILKDGDVKNAQDEARKLDMTPDEMFRWINENLPRQYEGEELTKGLDNLTKADIWLSRTRKTQEYKYWKYANDELTAGVSSARNGKSGGWTRWQPPKWHSKKGVSEELLQKIASHSGCSIQTTRREIIPFLSNMIPYCKPRELTVIIASWYDMDASELAELTGSGKTTNKVQDIIEDSKELKQEFDINPIVKEDNEDNEDIDTQDNNEDIDTQDNNEDIDTQDNNKDIDTQDNNEDDDEDDEDNQSSIGDFI